MYDFRVYVNFNTKASFNSVQLVVRRNPDPLPKINFNLKGNSSPDAYKLKNHSIHTDLELIHRLRAGDEVSLTIIYKKYWHSLFVFEYNFLKDKTVCEDILQDIFLYLWEKRETLQIISSLKGYLFTVARHLVFHHIKVRKLRRQLFHDLEEKLQPTSFEQVIDEKEISRQISSIVTMLPPRCREVYILSRQGFHSGKNIATMLNISNKTVENQITKALRILREQLEKC